MKTPKLIPEAGSAPGSEASSEPAASWWKRPMLITGAVILTVSLVAGTWALAAAFQSPQQREADASAPPPRPVFAEVTTGTLADVRSYTGSVAYGDETGFTLPTGADAVRSVVTGKPATAGGEVVSGDVLTEVNTRPVFLLASPFDFFRDMGVGDKGADIRVLQEALASQGYLTGADGEFGAQTASAVASWYEHAGYEIPTRPRPTEAASTGMDTTSSGSTGSTGSSGSSDSPGSDTDNGGASDVAPKLVLDAFVPVNEVLAVPSLPSTIIVAPAVGAKVGGEGTDVTFGSDNLIVRAEVPAADAEGITSGDPVKVLSGAEQVDGAVEGVEMRPAGEDGSPQPSLLTVSLATDKAALAFARGETVTIQVNDAVVAGESLIVPTAGVVGRGGGRGVVVKQQDDGSLTEVPVTVAGSLRGMTAITLDEADALAEGDNVRVG